MSGIEKKTDLVDKLNSLIANKDVSSIGLSFLLSRTILRLVAMDLFKIVVNPKIREDKQSLLDLCKAFYNAYTIYSLAISSGISDLELKDANLNEEKFKLYTRNNPRLKQKGISYSESSQLLYASQFIFTIRRADIEELLFQLFERSVDPFAKSTLVLLIEELEQDVSLVDAKISLKKWLELQLWNHQTKEIDELTIFFDESKKWLPNISSDTTIQNAFAKMVDVYKCFFAANNEQLESSSPETRVVPDSNQPIEDHLNRSGFIDGLTTLIKDKSNMSHLTIGLLGHWGAGKTRIMDLVRANVAKEEKAPFLMGEFNAWAYEHSKNIQACMAHEVIKALSTYQSPSVNKIKLSFIGRLSSSISHLVKQCFWIMTSRLRLSFGFASRKYPLKVITFFLWLALLSIILHEIIINPDLIRTLKITQPFDKGFMAIFGIALSLVQILKILRPLLAQPFTKELLTYVKLPSYAEHLGQISQMREDIKLMCEVRLRSGSPNTPGWLGNLGKPKRLLFVVDDLDRCGPAGIVKTFEAIRLVLDIPQVTVVIAVDQRIALSALALHYEKLEPHHDLDSAKAIARDYLGKMLQLPIIVEKPNADAVIGFLSHVWNDNVESQQALRNRLAQFSSNSNINKSDNSENQLNQNEINENDGNDGNDGNDADVTALLSGLDIEPLRAERKTELPTVGMSVNQKAAFVFWAQQFEFTNPRQLKRLHNSYNLLRLVSNYQDEVLPSDELNITLSQTFDKNETGSMHPLMMCLFALEFVNMIDDSIVSARYMDYLRTEELSEAETKQVPSVLKKTKKALQFFSATEKDNGMLSDKNYMVLDFVSAYVLPAIRVKLRQ